MSHNGQNSTIEFLSTPSARRATDRRVVDNSVHDISIHALREEGDLATHKCRQSVQYFYPRPPRGGRPASVGFAVAVSRFLSTPSARRATKTTADHGRKHKFLSTPSARRATGFNQVPRLDITRISIHALREEGDKLRSATLSSRSVFLSTPSARRATSCGRGKPPNCLHFYPRPPRGGRPFYGVSVDYLLGFLSTPSARRATDVHMDEDPRIHISIHALREEGDLALL